jgi:hypothetical protein
VSHLEDAAADVFSGRAVEIATLVNGDAGERLEAIEAASEGVDHVESLSMNGQGRQCRQKY